MAARFPRTRVSTALVAAVFVVPVSLTVPGAFGQDVGMSRSSPAPFAQGRGQSSAPRPADSAVADLRVDVPLVLIPAYVTTPRGRSVSGLKKDDFRLFENDVEQKISYFAQEDAPISLGLLFDSSSSMRNKLRRSWEAAAAFLKITNAGDEFFLIEFSERAKLTVPLTPDAGQVRTRLVRARPAGRTSLLDGIHLGLAQMKQARNLRKAIVILSDGGDNHSRHVKGEIKQAVREGDVQIYALGIFDLDGDPKRTPEEQNGPTLLSELAEETGGRHIPVDSIDELPAACLRISDELRNQYLLAYSPANPAPDGKYRRVKVTLSDPGKSAALNIRHRAGYYAPPR